MLLVLCQTLKNDKKRYEELNFLFKAWVGDGISDDL